MLAIYLFTVFEYSLFPRSLFFESTFNPASLCEKRVELVAGTCTHFGLSDLRSFTIHSQIKSYALDVLSFGSDIYRENVINAGFGFNATEKLATGFSVAVLNYWVKDNCNRFSYSLRLGSVFKNGPLEISGWINNFNIPKFSSIDYLPPNYSFRLHYLAKNNLALIFAIRGIEKDLPFFNFGLTYSPYRIITLGAGVNTEPIYLEYILRLNLGNFIISYAGSNHQYLGLSHCFNIGFNP